MTTTDSRLLLLSVKDNVLVCCKNIAANETILIEDVVSVVDKDIEIGHKVARCNIKAGEKIYKYGVSIGSARTAISAGNHVHMHNMKSDYISSHTRSGTSDSSYKQHRLHP